MNRTTPIPPAAPLAVLFALVLVQILFATHYVAAKEVVTVLPPRIWAAIRVLGAAALLLGMVAIRRQPLPRGGGLLLRFAGFSILGVVINQVCFVEGLSRTTPINSALINCTIPVLTFLLAILTGQEIGTRGRVAGIIVALAGIAVLLRLESFDPGDTLVQGNLLTVVNAASFSAFLVISRPTLRGIPTLPATALLFLLGSVPIVALAAPELPGLDLGSIPPGIWWLGAYIIVFPTVGAYLLNYWALRRAPSSLVAFFVYLQPVLAAVLSYFVRQEAPGPRDGMAFLLVGAGIALTVRDARGGKS